MKDSMQKSSKAKQIVQQILPVAIFLLIGVSAGYLMGQSFVRFSVSLIEMPDILILLSLLLLLYLSVFLQVILHEAGHLLCGLLTGYRFLSFRIGSCMLIKTDDRLRLKRLSIAGTGGQCLMLPPEYSAGKFPYVLYHLGGALMNFLTSVSFLLLYLYCPAHPLVSALFGALAITGFAIGVMNAVPLRLALLDNDGNTLLLLRKDPQGVFAFYRMLEIHGQIANGLRLRDMPEDWFTTPADADRHNSMIATIEVYRCNRLMDQQLIEQASESIRALLSSDAAVAGIHRSLLKCDLAYCAMMRGDFAAAQSELDEQQQKFMRSMKRFPSILRTQYAQALLQYHDAAKAEEIFASFESMAKKYPYPADIESERALMDTAMKAFCA
ncbi:MAG TPA: hypothetical protein DCY10_03385 [Clostridiales bacterium]|nr:hypothetical protein [Clostridiales bacterium]